MGKLAEEYQDVKKEIEDRLTRHRKVRGQKGLDIKRAIEIANEEAKPLGLKVTSAWADDNDNLHLEFSKEFDIKTKMLNPPPPPPPPPDPNAEFKVLMADLEVAARRKRGLKVAREKLLKYHVEKVDDAHRRGYQDARDDE